MMNRSIIYSYMTNDNLCADFVGCPPQTRDNIHRSLLTNRDFVSVVIFEEIRENAVDLLLNSWLRYLKEDLKAFIE